MFVVIYEFEVKQGSEKQFKSSWLKLTEGIYKQLGSLGSRLHHSEGNIYMAYAQWPDKKKWESAGKIKLSEVYESARTRMWETLLSSKTLYELEVDTDYLQNTSYKD